MLETASNVTIIIFPILVCMFVGIDRKKWGAWNKNKRIFFFISWLVIAAILMSNNLYIFVLVSIILFFTELYL
ncbi:hypothetical protein VBH21_07305 [Enterococcus hirae]|uniref:hypothetical protein n=1 Tax=Enterococcus TaxID=1350 RepID=UPI0009BEBB72|nr:hypothetical protein [Enterococcus hirae]EGP5164180.1 hypothetical protein [Enterococcus faecium]MBE8830990.1 hypothetical protein [Enterococcus hirae]OQO41218.1 hypothetical protein BH758_06690 [Enterococcus hirae]OQO49850.1 hypothetical protein BH735_06975 [Enterococcus hirae]OQO60627.1 hypothetical protein BH740_06525 [Enterococcus hirae]